MFWILGIAEFRKSYVPQATPLIFLLTATHPTTMTCPKLPTYYSMIILRNLKCLGMHVLLLSFHQLQWCFIWWTLW